MTVKACGSLGFCFVLFLVCFLWFGFVVFGGGFFGVRFTELVITWCVTESKKYSNKKIKFCLCVSNERSAFCIQLNHGE